MTTSSTRIAELAAQIAKDTAKVDDYRRANGLPTPSFAADGPSNLHVDSEEIEGARLSTIAAATELADLLQGPEPCLRTFDNSTSLQAIYRWSIASHVPLDGEISFGELAKRTGLLEHNLRRLLRYSIIYHHVFLEPRLGYVAHSAASRLLIDDPAAIHVLGLMNEEGWQAFARTCDAMERFPGQEPNETGFSLAYDTQGKTMWEYYASHPTMAQRFAKAMKAFTSIPGNSLSYVVSGYPWGTLPDDATIVDIGGSEGFVSKAIAAAFPKLKFVVQDLPQVVQNIPQNKDDAHQRVEFEAYNFLDTQTRRGDVYLFRWVLHNWSDPYVVKILRNQIPMLVKGAKIVINEQLLPEPGTLPLVVEKQIRYFDLVMLSLYNARERDGKDWEALFHEADHRFQDIKVWTPAGAARSFIEATWTG